MIYTSQLSHQAPTMSSSIKTSPRARHKTIQQASKPTTATGKSTRQPQHHHHHQQQRDQHEPGSRCRGRCRVQWSEQHVKEGLVLVQESQLARVVKTGPITEHYEIDPKPFASGQWARVFKCRSRATGIVYAAKFSSRNRFNADCSAELRHEIALLSLCSQSPRVVRLHDVYETPKEIIMIMEYAPGGDLQTLIDGDLVPLEGDVVNFVRQLVEGLAYLHERNIAHLDIKPQNLVMMGNFPDCNVKLCDFEISRVVLEGTEVREILGTPDYVAPEILHYEPITLAADMWSLGVTTYVLLTGFSPFGGETDQETFKNIILGQVDFPEELFEDVSAQAKDFVAKLLVLEPSARMSAKQCLRHEWLRTAPTQASSHLRKYLSKSREVLLERVVSRENLRRAALLSQTANGLQQQQQQPGEQQQWIGLSQSEMCLNRALNGSNGSLSLAGSGSEDYEAGAQDISSSRTSLADSVSSSKSSLAMSQSCLLNKEQTEGLLHQAQDRRSLRASMAQGLNRIGLLSKIRSLNQVQSRSQACLPLLNGLVEDEDRRGKRGPIVGHPLNGCQFDGSREKLYGLKSLSKSQGMLDIYRSLESLQRHKRDLSRHKERSKTEDALPFFRHLGHGSSSGSLGSGSSTRSATLAREFPDLGTSGQSAHDSQANQRQKTAEPATVTIEQTTTSTTNLAAQCQNENENRKQRTSDCESGNDKNERLPCANEESEAAAGSRLSASLGGGGSESRSTGPSSLTVSEANLDSLQSLESDTLTDDSEETGASRSLSNKQSSAGSECHYGRETDSENEEPKYTVAQLVSAFNKHQEVASRTSLEAIMSEKRVPADDPAHFPIGPKALRLFIPDIDISERKPLVRRKTSYKPRKNWEELRKQNEKNEGLPNKDFFNDSGNEDDAELNPHEDDPTAPASPPAILTDDHLGIVQLRETSLDTRIDEKYKQCVESARKNERQQLDQTSSAPSSPASLPRTASPTSPISLSPASLDSGVNLRDILQKIDADEGKLSPEKKRSTKPPTRDSSNNNNNNNNENNNKNSNNNNNNNNLASRISIFSSDKRGSISPTRPESKSRLAVKEKLCTGSYVRAMERFSSKSNVEKQQQPRSRRTSATQIGEL